MTYVYSFDKGRIDAFEAEHPDFDLEGLSEHQVEHLLEESEALLAANGVVLTEDDDEITDVTVTPSEAPVSASEPEATSSLTPAVMRAWLLSQDVSGVGTRGRLRPEHIAMATKALS